MHICESTMQDRFQILLLLFAQRLADYVPQAKPAALASTLAEAAIHLARDAAVASRRLSESPGPLSFDRRAGPVLARLRSHPRARPIPVRELLDAYGPQNLVHSYG